MKLRKRSRIVLLKNVCRGVSRKGTLSMKDGSSEEVNTHNNIQTIIYREIFNLREMLLEIFNLIFHLIHYGRSV